MTGRGARRSVSMADIAKLADVSVTTVSHVVNKSRPVSPEKERAVLNAIAQTGYVPDTLLRSQRVTGNQTIGLALSAISNVYFADVVHSIEVTASRAGYSLLLVDTHDDIASELRAVSELLSRRVDGIILAPSPDSSAALRHADLRKIPVVEIDRLTDDEVDQVGAENTEATAKLVDHLAEIGHRRIAMVSGRAGLSTSTERVAGFRMGLQRNGIPEVPELIVGGESTDEGASAALRVLLANHEPPTAVVVGNNLMTIGVMRAAREAGIEVPRDLALVAFDDFAWADLFHPRLTTIAQPIGAMGEHAVELLLSRLVEPNRAVRRVVLRPTFMHRESCGCTD